MSDEILRSKIGPLPPEIFDGDPAQPTEEDLEISHPGWSEEKAAMVALLRKRLDEGVK